MQLGQYPAPRHAVAHLSDPHLLAGGMRQYGVVDTEAGLARALERLRNLDPAPQALVFTGDLADKGEPAAYARLRELVEPAAAEVGAIVVWVMGNHDERAPYSRELYGTESEAPQDRVHDVDGLRIVALDTSVPGYHHGELTDDQLAWLADVLATPAPHGTLLAMHHPPIATPTMPAAAVIELFDQHRLAEAITGTDVRGILGGHFHYSSYSTFAGVPVSVASATCYTADPAPADRLLSGVDGHYAFTMMHLYDDPDGLAGRSLVHTVVPVAQATEVSGQPLTVIEELRKLSPADRLEILSRKDSPFNQHAEDHSPR